MASILGDDPMPRIALLLRVNDALSALQCRSKWRTLYLHIAGDCWRTILPLLACSTGEVLGKHMMLQVPMTLYATNTVSHLERSYSRLPCFPRMG